MRRIAERHGITETVDVDGMTVPCLRELDVVLMFDRAELNMFSYRGVYSAARVVCKGFGRGSTAERWNPETRAYDPLACLGENCDWSFDGVQIGNSKVTCKPHGVLKVALRDAPLLGALYVLRTRSARSIGAIMGGMQLVQVFSGGKLAGLPFRLKVVPWTSKEEMPNGRVETRRYPLITMAYAGDTPALMDAVTALADKQFVGGAELRERLEQRLIAAYNRSAEEESENEDQDELEELSEAQGDPEEKRPARGGAALLPPAEKAPPAPAAPAPAAPTGEDAEEMRADRLAHLAKLCPNKDARDALKKKVKDAGMEWVRSDQAPLETLDEYIRIAEGK
jgi:hypothetical protein